MLKNKRTIKDGDWVIVYALDIVGVFNCLMRVNYTPSNQGEWYCLQTEQGEVFELNPMSPEFHGMKLADPPLSAL